MKGGRDGGRGGGLVRRVEVMNGGREPQMSLNDRCH